MGREIASAIASASAMSVLLDLTKGFTNWAGTILAVCPNLFAFLESQLLPGQASIPIVINDARERKSISCSLIILARNTGLPFISRPTAWKEFLPISIPE